ncbi:MAG: GNAT family N-acetyltransferase [Balneolales bacterium]|nr:GNAT family N-acetyltransferase [Balneolales bacterium]
MTTNKLNFFSKENPPAEEVDLLRAALRAYNISAAGQKEYSNLMFSVFTEKKEFVGGVFGNIAWEWLHIDLLWVHPHYRGNDIGTKLMDMIEEAAKKKTIFRFRLNTATFQALEFYQKRGYEIAGEIEDMPPGHSTFFLKKVDEL